MDVNDIINRAKKELNTKEFPPNSNNVKYNTWFYGHEVHDGFPTKNSAYPWCAVFISYIFKDSNLVKKTASCLNMLEWFEANKRIVKDPKPGDIVFFKYSTNKRRTNHVGLVISVADKNNFLTIEGNTSIKSDDNGGAVMERRRTMANVVAFARPNYNNNTKEQYPTIKKGSKGDYVELLQELLNVKGIQTTVDGDFGLLTESSVKKFQAIHGLTMDGIVGPKTWKELQK